MDETQNYGDEHETFTQDDQTSTSQERSTEIDSLKEDLSYIKDLLTQKNVQAAPVAKTSDIQLDAATLERFKNDPTALVKFIKDQTESSKLEIKKEAAKQSWDRRAEEKFPLIKTNKDFQKKVSAQIREFTSTGEYSSEDPMLVYRAAQLVSAEFAPQQQRQSDKGFMTSAEGRSNVSRESSTSKPKISDNDPRVNFAKLLGIDGTRLEKFKSQLGPYVAPTRKQGRRLSK